MAKNTADVTTIALSLLLTLAAACAREPSGNKASWDGHVIAFTMYRNQQGQPVDSAIFRLTSPTVISRALIHPPPSNPHLRNTQEFDFSKCLMLLPDGFYWPFKEVPDDVRNARFALEQITVFAKTSPSIPAQERQKASYLEQMRESCRS